MKKATASFKEHESSSAHNEAAMKLARIKSDEPDVETLLNTQKEEQQKRNRHSFLKEVSSIRVLARQGLSLRGHTEEDGNLFQLMKARAEDDKNIEKWLQDGAYMSHDIVNEIIKIMGNSILRKLIEEIQKTDYYAVLADETRDISNKEQLVICIRWVDSQYTVFEEPIGMFNIPQTDSAAILAAMKDVLLRCSLPIEKCRGQGYDGASNMMGRLNGVASKLKSEQPAAIAVHCLAHCTNLVLQDVCKKVKPVRDALDITREISRLIKFSPKREVLFMKNQLDASQHGEVSALGPSIKPLCTTRWTARTRALEAVLKNYTILQTTFREVNITQHDDNGRAAGGVAVLMENFQTYWGLKLSHLVFSAAEELSRTLQSKDITSQEAQIACKSVQQYYQKLRQDDLEFDHVYNQAVNEASELGIEPTLPRYRKRPRRVEDGQEQHRFDDPKALHKQEYVEVLELLIGQLEARFSQRDFNTVCDIEEMLLNAANGKSVTIPESITLYSQDIDVEKLETQLKLLHQFINVADETIKSITPMRSLAQVLNSCHVAKKMLSEVDILLRIYFTIPVTTATAERSFSCLRRLKTWLRSTMSQERLNNLLLVHVHKNVTDSLSLQEIAQEFTAVNEKRRSVFGSFKS